MVFFSVIFHTESHYTILYTITLHFTVDCRIYPVTGNKSVPGPGCLTSPPVEVNSIRVISVSKEC